MAIDGFGMDDGYKQLGYSKRVREGLATSWIAALVLTLELKKMLISCFPNSTFSTNLTQALDTLQHHTSPTGFNSTITATATALALCRGSLTPSECQTCIADAVVAILRVCPNQTAAAQVWYDYCMVRYSNDDFIGKVNITIASAVYDPAFAPHPDSYVKSVRFLTQNLSSTAAASGKRFALGMTQLLDDQRLYGYFDCTRDISTSDCSSCFSAAMEFINLWCITRRVCWILTPSCNVQFSMDPAHIDWVIAPLILPPGVGGKKSGLKVKISMGVAGAVALIVGVGLVVAFVRAKRKTTPSPSENAEMMMRREGMGRMMPFPFSLDDLIIATNNFSFSNLLGRGGFGTVYKGRLPDGEKIAVKKLANGSVQGLEFFNEVKVLLNMQHRNLVRLLGCCVEGDQRMLIYEYLSNKSLDTILFDKRRSGILDWPKRYNIIVGITRGLLYLHEDSLFRIVHRDIKAGNILLDEQMNPKISDFGLAKLFCDEKSHLTTHQVAGTYGYMAPEYANKGWLSMKSDVFSFGVLMLEIISGRKNHDVQFDSEQQDLLNLTWKLEQEGRLMELVDATMGAFPEEEVSKFMRIGLLCCQECIQERPTVYSILSIISNSSATVPPAGRPGYHSHGQSEAQQPRMAGSDGAPSNQENRRLSVINSITTSLVTQGR
ncbi:cysteine-rich receptor-like protein kinase 25 [Diospyros lotus]|uniref:cysteine-rich receptor-like protein kinase 25 n=1 Tax=Diospyros lotus TaxID=55363 RepID=UPI00225BD0FE|nr:cysteine-rich receptor-like protein kinase 25 [Diospyros lotus]